MLNTCKANCKCGLTLATFATRIWFKGSGQCAVSACVSAFLLTFGTVHVCYTCATFATARTRRSHVRCERGIIFIKRRVSLYAITAMICLIWATKEGLYETWKDLGDKEKKNSHVHMLLLRIHSKHLYSLFSVNV